VSINVDVIRVWCDYWLDWGYLYYILVYKNVGIPMGLSVWNDRDYDRNYEDEWIMD
jgi:hypothetical protein